MRTGFNSGGSRAFCKARNETVDCSYAEFYNPHTALMASRLCWLETKAIRMDYWLRPLQTRPLYFRQTSTDEHASLV